MYLIHIHIRFPDEAAALLLLLLLYERAQNSVRFEGREYNAELFRAPFEECTSIFHDFYLSCHYDF